MPTKPKKNEICSASEFKKLALAVVRASPKKIYLEDEVLRKLRLNLVLTNATKENLKEALTVIIMEIADRVKSKNVRYADVEELIQGQRVVTSQHTDGHQEAVEADTSDVAGSKPSSEQAGGHEATVGVATSDIAASLEQAGGHEATVGVATSDVAASLEQAGGHEATVGGETDDVAGSKLERDDAGSETEWQADSTFEEKPLFAAKKILDSFTRDGKTYYWVDWEPTAEPRENLPMALIAAFKRERRALVRKVYIDDEAVEA